MTREELNNFDLPEEPGVYLFRGPKTDILYIGKAAVLRDRVRSYFGKDLAESRSEAIVKMVADATQLTWEQTDSVLEALILEANLIKQHQPPYNSMSKDNKSFNYLVIANEAYPRILIVRGRELFLNWSEADIKKLLGPFPDGGALKEALKIVRKIFPFRDSKCTPCEEQLKSKAKKGKNGTKVGPLRARRDPTFVDPSDSAAVASCKPCFNRQIGLCPGICTGEMSKDEYAIRIKHISDLFSGNFHGLKRDLAREMKEASGEERFENARTLHRQIESLDHIRDVSLIKNERAISSGGGVRIEAYDTAHTGGAETVAVMTVVSNGELVKDAYRKFKIQTTTNDDVGALKEALSRRLNHSEWPLPRVFVIDGGIPQLRAAERLLKAAGIAIPVVGVVKNDAHKPERLIGDSKSIKACERDILLANAEAHRFAITWHRTRSRRAMF